MRIPVGVVDYGMGNLHSVAKALSLQGGRVTVSDKPAQLKRAKLLVLPGVGSFGAASKTLKRKKLDQFIRAWIRDGRPYLGICLGFQLLFESSQEDPGVPGLGVFKGRVVRFPKGVVAKRKLKIPHMGWNTAGARHQAAKPYFKGIPKDDYFYFVHEYFPVPKDKKVVATSTSYGQPFCSSVVRDNLFASQFHPEKSGAVGLRLLKNVMSMASAA